jgi:DeoR family glycerol-3-phosphate regulon repressor
MIISQRHEDILRQLEEKNQVLVKELAKQYEVSEDCIRKDLAALEKQGKLKRVHGGARNVRSTFHIQKAKDRMDVYAKEKQEAAAMILDKIEGGETIFLGVSSTNLEIAIRLKEAGTPVTVVTNMTAILDVLSQDPDFDVIFVGGRLNAGRDGFVGAMTIEQLKQWVFDVAVLGAVGINADSGTVMTYDEQDGLTKQAVLAAARKKILACEAAKFQQDGSYVYAHLSDFDAVCCGGASPALEAKIAENLGK